MKEDRNTYQIIDDLQVGETERRVLILDRDFDSFESNAGNVVRIGEKEYKYDINSVHNIVVIKSRDSFTGITAVFY